MALATEKDDEKKLRDIANDDGADPLRADVMGSIAKNDPSSPAYLGKMDNYITAHGAAGRMMPGTRGYGLAVGATTQPTLRPSTMTPAMAPDIGSTPNGDLPLGGPLMQPAKPQQGWLGKIGNVTKRMGNIAGDIFAPGAMAMIPGTDLNKRIEAARAERASEKQRQLGIEERRVGVEEAKEKREAETAGQPKPKEESWEVSKEYTGPHGEPVEVEKNSGMLRIAGSDVPGIKRIEKPEKEVNAQEQVRRDLLAAMRGGDKDKIATFGEQLEKLSDPMGEKEAMRSLQMELARQRVQEKNSKNAALSTQAQEILMNTEPTLQQVDQLLAALEPLKKDNKSRLTLSRIGYALGNASPEGSLAADISKLELDRVVAGARVLKGSSRAYQALELAMKHAPNSWVDTPNLMYDKLKNIRQNLADVIEDAKKFGVKNLGAGVKTGTEKTGGKIATEEPERPANVPKDYVYKADGPKGAGWYKPSGKR